MFRLRIFGYGVLLSFFLPSLNLIFAKTSPGSPKRYLMAILGDSISAASLAQTNVQKETVNDLLDRINENLEDVHELAKELSHGNIPFYENKETLSWGSGNSVASHFKKLKLWYWKYDPTAQLSVKNYAVPGSTTDDLHAQIVRLKSDLGSGHYDELVYVGLTIGANDACSTETFKKESLTFEGMPNSRFRTNLEKMFTSLSEIKQKKSIRILFQSIPKIPDLGFPEIMDYRSNEAGFTCRFARKHIFTYCPVLPFWTSDEEYNHYTQIVLDKNDILSQVIEDSNKKHPKLRAYLSTSMFKTEITPKILAIDCFHPNHRAQESLSESSFEDQPWYRFSQNSHSLDNQNELNQNGEEL